MDEPKKKVIKKIGVLQKLSEKIHISCAFDEETNQVIISGMGELHLDIIVDRMPYEFRLVNVGKPEVAYKKTLRKRTEGKFIRQTVWCGQCGTRFDIEPGEWKWC